MLWLHVCVYAAPRIVETEKEPEFFLITAPLHVLAQRAELLKMRVMVNPDQDTGRFQVMLGAASGGCCMALADAHHGLLVANLRHREILSPRTFFEAAQWSSTSWRRGRTLTPTRITLLTLLYYSVCRYVRSWMVSFVQRWEEWRPYHVWCA